MANNRMFLVNDRLKVAVCLAKYYPSTGWYLVDSDDYINQALDLDDAEPDMTGPTDWRLAYESTAEASEFDVGGKCAGYGGAFGVPLPEPSEEAQAIQQHRVDAFARLTRMGGEG